MLEKPRPNLGARLEKPGQKWRWNRIWFRCGFFCVCKKFPPYLALLCSATKALYLKSLLNVRVKNKEAEFENFLAYNESTPWYRDVRRRVIPENANTWVKLISASPILDLLSAHFEIEAKQRRGRPFWIHIRQRRLISSRRSRSSWSSGNWPGSSD